MDSDTAGIPASPTPADTEPSCMTPSPDRSGSSSWSARTPPTSFWYWSARRSIRALGTGRPSSVNATAPASRSSAISVSSSPAIARVIAAMNPTGTEASRSARRRSAWTAAAQSTGGSVFGIASTPH